MMAHASFREDVHAWRYYGEEDTRLNDEVAVVMLGHGLLANRSSVPAPDDEKLSLTAGLTPKASVSAVPTAPAVIAPGVMAWP